MVRSMNEKKIKWHLIIGWMLMSIAAMLCVVAIYNRRYDILMEAALFGFVGIGSIITKNEDEQ